MAILHLICICSIGCLMQFLCSSPPGVSICSLIEKTWKKNRPAKNENVSAQIRASFAQEPRKLQVQRWPRSTSFLRSSPAPSGFKQRDHEPRMSVQVGLGCEDNTAWQSFASRLRKQPDVQCINRPEEEEKHSHKNIFTVYNHLPKIVDRSFVLVVDN